MSIEPASDARLSDHDDRGPTPRSVFEKELEREITENAKDSVISRFDVINKPAALWLMTTVIAGLFGYIYTNYTNCRTSQNADDEMISKIVYEVSGRRKALDNAWLLSPTPYSPDINEKIRKSSMGARLNPDTTYIFLEFKGATTEFLSYQAKRLFKKWSLWHPNVPISDDDDPSDGRENKEDPAGSRFVGAELDSISSFDEYAGKYVQGIGDQSTVPRSVLNYLQLSRRPAYLAEHQAEAHFIPASSCIARSVWPF